LQHVPVRESRARASRAARTALALAIAIAATACDRSPARPDVLLVTVDTLRPDHLSLYGHSRPTSPHIDRLFAEAAVFERAYATEANTPPSVVSLLSGLHPQDHRVRIFYQLIPDEIRILPDLLPPEYQTAGFVSNIVLTDEAIGLAGRFDHYDDFVDELESYRGVFERRAGRTTDAALTWLREDRDPGRPLLLWVHYIDPHGPYDAPPDKPASFSHEGRRAVGAARIQRYQLKPGVDDALDYVDRYDEEIAYMDAQVGRLLDGYARTRPLEEALVILTADHGETMLERAIWFMHGHQVFEEIVRVPLLLRGPGVQSGRRGELVSGIDVAPTVLRFVGVEPPPNLRGRVLLAPSNDENRFVYAEATLGVRQWRTAVGRRHKWALLRTPGDRVSQRRYYDLERDPGERLPRSWAASDPPPPAFLERIAGDPEAAGRPLESSKGVRIDAPKVSPRADEADLERLRALGYVE